MPRWVHINLNNTNGGTIELNSKEIDQLHALLTERVGVLDACAAELLHLAAGACNAKDGRMLKAARTLAQRDAANDLIERIFGARIEVIADIRTFITDPKWHESESLVRRNQVTLVAFFEAMVRDGQMERVVENGEIRYQIRIAEPH